MPYSARLQRLESAIEASPLGAMVLNAGPSLPYMTGLHVHLSERPVVACFSPGTSPTLVLPALETQKVQHLPFGMDVYTYSESLPSWHTAFEAALGHLPEGVRIGVEDGVLRFLELNYMQKAAPSAQFVSGEEIMASLRMRKDITERTLMKEAVRMAEEALRSTLPHVKPGVTEREISSRLIARMLDEGSGGELPFQPIIAFGPNSANPHAVPTDYAAREGDLILFDWGANNRGYFSDLTRTFVLGEPDDVIRRIYQTVEKANAAGRAAGKPGVTAGSLDAATRDVIDQAGFGPQFVHRTGHGIGLDVHEPPYIRSGNDVLLEPGMTYTIEPGIYVPEHGGVRIEDDMIVTEDGCESLTTYPRELTILPV
ncbi:MAG: peptidase M24 [Bacteroidetes bacterium CG12_big_fil_rev_8_21_14_0_65_60_17]|nr:MAG: peptidase M24 [Bacteroidetes bacterium CG12_big_fil_rev_8_21_14_0_65_60_17]